MVAAGQESRHMRQYHDLLRHVRQHGRFKADRTGTGTYSLFGAQTRYPLADGFPLVTTKKIHLKSILYELLWFLRGETHVRWLQERGVTIWDEWATPEACARFGRAAGELGPVYGHQWTNFGATPIADGTYQRDGVHQLKWVIDEIRRNPDSRRLIVTGWHPREQSLVALPPCHTLFQFYVSDGALSCQLYQRSADIFLGVPFNIASYAALTAMVAQVTGLKLGDFVHTFGDIHLYANHLEQADLQLSRTPRPLPKLALNPVRRELSEFVFEDFCVEGYDPHPAIKAPVAV